MVCSTSEARKTRERRAHGIISKGKFGMSDNKDKPWRNFQDGSSGEDFFMTSQVLSRKKAKGQGKDGREKQTN